ncbi:hypothetical protein ELQ92_02825 [Labedella populi]|uniref:Gfo/Idh/MocA-like oxidoreductase C-terminal domain-containing protein n=1 Tax=Labedella populi TaxID=2498850 RepID=A0A444QF09_9MICO|nr:hypothetical protein [Labedella populi]RWZ68186.1 hypothetical protein ELQ92_02825 [Labedella populi]
MNVDGESPRTFTVAGDTSYDHQLAALLDALRSGAPLSTPGEDIVANAEAIEATAVAAAIAAPAE